ncbi:MAG: hypothetical protein PHR25_01655 [Clostridia bacterium]|nr:hypothetical protein [Clostridia bacterium]MDD4375468.1 hypothetical protein [Clostridia bacterium]
MFMYQLSLNYKFVLVALDQHLEYMINVYKESNIELLMENNQLFI